MHLHGTAFRLLGQGLAWPCPWGMQRHSACSAAAPGLVDARPSHHAASADRSSWPACPAQGRVTSSTLTAMDDVEVPVLDEAVHQEAARGHTELRLAGGGQGCGLAGWLGCVAGWDALCDANSAVAGGGQGCELAGWAALCDASSAVAGGGILPVAVPTSRWKQSR